MTTINTGHPHLSGNFAPIRSEDDFDLPVHGRLPAALHGTLYRNGPNPQFEPRGPYHWFSGDGMLHAFRIGAGKATYSNRYVRTPKWQVEHAAGRALFAGFNAHLNDPLAQGCDGGTANTSIVHHAGRLLALNEAYPPFAVEPQSLAAGGYAAAYRGPVTAHPKIDPRSGEMLWFAYGTGPQPLNSQMTFGITDAAGRITRCETFAAPFCAIMHDFLVTENWVIFPAFPLTGSLERAQRGLPPIAWEPDRGTHVGLLRRDAPAATIRWLRTDACHAYHMMNAWEEHGRLHADMFRYDSAPMFPQADGTPRRHCMARLWRWSLDPQDAGGIISQTAIDDLDGEFPRIDDRRSGLPYRHGWYGADTRGCNRAEPLRLNAIAHLDLASGRRAVYELPPGDLVSEPVFVPRAADAGEGEGWLLAVVWRANQDRSDLVVLDALDVAAGPLAVAALPRRVPFGFHGSWVDAGDAAA